ncbi:hypothetical protein E2553_35070 [Paraburkholderia dipogonis]|uniref:Uncharacterized protein n=2 Tax=Paraburkholderia dipogonis TaxID=1211383 RepID=A0A4Y8MWQ4_9BURK|nr:hypothetical protein [Paraburkholderia dipogonis]TFE41864.1 hypothetical protein E2553_35070 [Paraburkholderia dipogonis]
METDFESCKTTIDIECTKPFLEMVTMSDHAPSKSVDATQCDEPTKTAIGQESSTAGKLTVAQRLRRERMLLDSEIRDWLLDRDGYTVAQAYQKYCTRCVDVSVRHVSLLTFMGRAQKARFFEQELALSEQEIRDWLLGCEVYPMTHAYLRYRTRCVELSVPHVSFRSFKRRARVAKKVATDGRR